MCWRSVCAVAVAALLIGCKVSGPVVQPQAAGSFYPADQGVLANAVDTYLDQAVLAPDPEGGRLLAMLTPHAGYDYSGWVAAYGFKHLKDLSGIHTVILIGASHRNPLIGASVFQEGALSTPLGQVEVDWDIAAELLSPANDVNYVPQAFIGEHPIETQLPFLQRVLPEFKIVPIFVGTPTRKMYDHLASKLAEILLRDPGAIVIVSSDLSHFYEYTKAVQMDSRLIEALGRLSIIDVDALIRSKEAEACSAYPIMIVLDAVRRVGGNQGELFKYANSGDVVPVRDSVVGYASMGFYRNPLTDEDKKELLALARRSIMERVLDGRIAKFETTNPKFLADGAVFVTIDIAGQLRGCIGHVRPFMPLYESVLKNAMNASSSDHRFKPMTTAELERMEIEISVLSPLTPIQDASEIEIGRHGVYMVAEESTAVFLPSVAVEFGWNRERLLKELSLKAGLAEDAWKLSQLYVFTAEVFSELDYQPRIHKK